MDITAQIFNTDKFLLFTRQKIGSSYVTKQYQRMYNLDDGDMNSKQLPWITLDSIDLASFRFGYPRETNDETALLLLKDIEVTWNAFINKSSKKDLILLIRHPRDRFISAFYQDCISPLLSNNDSSNYLTLRNMLIGKISTEDFIKFENEYLNQRSDGLSWLYNGDRLNAIIAKAITSHVIQLFQMSNLSIETAHNHYYLYKYEYLLTSNIIDNSKIKIIDIDSTNIASVLNKYDVHKFPTTKENPSGWRMIIKSVFDNEYPLFFKKILRELNHETFHYNLLINSPNFINTKD